MEYQKIIHLTVCYSHVKLASLAKWTSACLRSKWLRIPISLQSNNTFVG